MRRSRFLVASLIVGGLLALAGCRDKPTRGEMGAAERVEARNLMASLTGVQSITVSHPELTKSEDTLPMSDVRLPDDYEETADVRVTLTDGSVIEIQGMGIFGVISEYADTDYAWRTKGLHSALVTFEAPVADGDEWLILNGKKYNLDPAEAVLTKPVVAWCKHHFGQTRGPVMVTDSTGHRRSLMLTARQLKAYHKWAQEESRNADLSGD
ncbi:hypothetical protein [Lacticaseibacillus nasuensis]|uniref:Lipoprotein n=1 Tax=Lacticaseibacillus nasuensis JCM 17158 TaxID=1291734 RepID=A0A0R1JR53_9LACO|nr:hypothetical protein [Lacticaseibacillus nasuensis]KRK70884.1 hypothetical protein FD02_GL000065 [Lacticaseibacillus nasuensis JCM 17158]